MPAPRHPQLIRRDPYRQRGVVLITLVLVILVAGSYFVLKALNVASRNAGYDPVATQRALKEAKLALIGYAVGYPDRPGVSDLTKGPGWLPCPDYRFDDTPFDERIGIANSCSLAAGTETGLFPWDTVGTNELRDGAGARLWYAVSDIYRSNGSGVINSDTVDTDEPIMRVDGSDEIVAIIIAPGVPVTGQDRGTGITDIYDPAQYLEGENATTGDNAFTATKSAALNDDVLVITRDELIAAVEQRVLVDVSRSLRNSYARYGGFPWASVYADPATKILYGDTINQTEGQLPIHIAGESFPVSFNMRWDVPTDGVLTGTGDPSDACLRSNVCTATYSSVTYPFTDDVTLSGTCLWDTAEIVDCTAAGSVLVAVGTSTLTRNYNVTVQLIPAPTPEPVVTTSTSAAVGRTRSLTVTGPLSSGSNVEITIGDSVDGAPNDERTFTFNAAQDDSVVEVVVSNLPFRLGDDINVALDPNNSPGGLPRWFTANLWHRHIYYAFADSYRLEDGSPCTPGTSCLTVVKHNDQGVVEQSIDSVDALVMVAGSLVGGSARGAAMSTYFELDNDQQTTPDLIYRSGPPNNTFNDQLTIIDVTP